MFIGIDLGTTNTVVAIVQDGATKVIDTPERLQCIPSVVCYSAGEFFVGQAAKDMAQIEPENTVYSVKRLMGMQYPFSEVTPGKTDGTADTDPLGSQNPSERQFLEIKQNVGYRFVPDPEGVDDNVRILFDDKAGNKVYKTPEEISAMILKKAKEDAQRVCGPERITGAVISYPAYFEEKQIEATKRAGELAGFDKTIMIQEPTAAAIAAGFGKAVSKRYFLVYDLGGGTFDLSLLLINERQFTVDALDGDNWLGGDDCDNTLVRLVAKHIIDTYSVDPMEDRMFRARIKPTVESVKIQLSAEDYTVVNAIGVTEIPMNRGLSMRPVNVSGLRIERSDYESSIQPLIDQTGAVIDRLFDQSDVSPNDVDHVLLVGGATLTPAVHRFVERRFPGKVSREVDPMHCVAIGAAIHAKSEFDKQQSKQSSQASGLSNNGGQVIDLRNVMPRSLGIEIVSDDGQIEYKIIVPRGTRLSMRKPIDKRLRILKPDRIFVPVYAGEQPWAANNLHQGNIELELDKPAEPGSSVVVGLRVTEERFIEVSIQPQGLPAVVKSLKFGVGPGEDEEWIDELEYRLEQGDEFLTLYREFIPDVAAEQLRINIEKAELSLADKKKREGILYTKRIVRQVFYLEELGSLLFTANNLITNLVISQNTRIQLGHDCAIAKDRYRINKRQHSAESDAILRQVKGELEIRIALALRELPSRRAAWGYLGG